jgi:tRNA dimethylallyltransferase
MSAPGPAPTVLAIVGPTASGKTELSLSVAARMDAEIVSVDSRQVYRGMDIGTAKVMASAREQVPHHGLDLVDPAERYSAGRFARDARRWIREIRERGRTPLLVGGTGFFLRALLDPIFREPPLDPARQERLRAYLRNLSTERLVAWTWALDPGRARLAVEGGPQRMSRTIEVALLSGRRLSDWHRTALPDGAPIEAVVVRLDLPREEMDRRIDARVGTMVRQGLVDEVRTLLEGGASPEAPGMSATGYREIVRVLRGKQELAEALEDIRRETRRYARRQLTWMRHQLPGDTRVVDATRPLEDQTEAVLEAWRESAGPTAVDIETGGRTG